MSDSASHSKGDDLDIFDERLERDGVVCSSVPDGHVLAFKREYLQRILDKYPDRDRLVIFVQKPGAPS